MYRPASQLQVTIGAAGFDVLIQSAAPPRVAKSVSAGPGGFRRALERAAGRRCGIARARSRWTAGGAEMRVRLTPSGVRAGEGIVVKRQARRLHLHCAEASGPGAACAPSGSAGGGGDHPTPVANLRRRLARKEVPLFRPLKRFAPLAASGWSLPEHSARVHGSQSTASVQHKAGSRRRVRRRDSAWSTVLKNLR